MRSLLFLVPSALLAALVPAAGQSFASDTGFVANARTSAIKRYTEEVGVNSSFYNGSEYHEYSPQLNEHPYLVPDWTYGTVVYGREQYDHVPLLFDIAEDQLITSYIHGNPIRLVRERVQSFTLNDTKFIRVDNRQVPSGFYQLVYGNKTSFLIRRQKTFHTVLDGSVLRNAFDFKIEYYLVKDGKFHTIRGERGLLVALGDHRQELKRFIRDRNIRFHVNKERSAYSILQYYDQLTP